jgi:hypothetical protein
MADKKTCFVIAPIGPQGSDIRKRSDHVLKHVIEETVQSFGYEALRADQIPEPGIITSQVIQRIIDAPLVIADLTDSNPNVFYELAIRHAILQPVVHLIDAKQQPPFDIHTMRAVQIATDEPEGVERAKKQLAAQIEAIEQQRADPTNPISFAAPELVGLMAEWCEVRGKRNTPRRIIVYGDVIGLQHVVTNAFLSSDSTSYTHPKTSGQQRVFASHLHDSNSNWLVKGPHGTPEGHLRGTAVRNGHIIRLQHVDTSHNLHSHLGYYSPVTGQQEVTAYGESGIGDTSDNWRLELAADGCWRMGSRMKLIHWATNRPLHSHQGRNFEAAVGGWQEVTCFPGTDVNDYWRVVEVEPGEVSDSRRAATIP